MQGIPQPNPCIYIAQTFCSKSHAARELQSVLKRSDTKYTALFHFYSKWQHQCRLYLPYFISDVPEHSIYLIRNSMHGKSSWQIHTNYYSSFL